MSLEALSTKKIPHITVSCAKGKEEVVFNVKAMPIYAIRNKYWVVT